MNRRRLALGCGVGLVVGAGAVGCTAVLGDFSVTTEPGADGGSDSGLVEVDSSVTSETGAGEETGVSLDSGHPGDTGAGGNDTGMLAETGTPDGTAPVDSSVAGNDGASKDGAVSDGTTGDGPVASNEASAADTGTVDSGIGIDAAVCTGTVCGTTCVTLATDAQNCNRCGHDCGTGATCAAGVCQPVAINARATGATALAIDQPADNPTSAALHVFWATSGMGAGVFQDNVTGGNVITLDSSFVSGTNAIAVHGQNVYWQAYNPGNGSFSIEQATIGTAATQSSVGNSMFSAGSLEGLLYDTVGNYIYGAYDTGAGTGFGMYRCPAASATPGCSSIGSFTGMAAKNIATDGTTYVFMADQNAGFIEQITLVANDESAFVTGQGTPTLLRVNGSYLYWVNSGPMTISRCLTAGSSPAQVASANHAPDGLAADAVYVYFTDSTAGTISYAPIGGGGPVTPYVTQTASATPMLLVRDSKSLYWNNGTSLYRVALP
jgi:hypothetical protein